MSNLNTVERMKLEKLFEMEYGYVLDFSNRTLQEFVATNLGRDIYDEKYNYVSGSKANRIRAFWEKESAPVVGKLIEHLLEHWRTSKMLRNSSFSGPEKALYDDCIKIAERLKKENVVENIDVIKVDDEADQDYKILVKSLRDSIERNEPEAAIDRLHTFTVKYFRKLCDKHSIDHDKKHPYIVYMVLMLNILKITTF